MHYGALTCLPKSPHIAFIYQLRPSRIRVFTLVRDASSSCVHHQRHEGMPFEKQNVTSTNDSLSNPFRTRNLQPLISEGNINQAAFVIMLHPQSSGCRYPSKGSVAGPAPRTTYDNLKAQAQIFITSSLQPTAYITVQICWHCTVLYSVCKNDSPFYGQNNTKRTTPTALPARVNAKMYMGRNMSAYIESLTFHLHGQVRDSLPAGPRPAVSS
jgi:hypothetical protein